MVRATVDGLRKLKGIAEQGVSIDMENTEV
jgi:hypothetical protein